MTVRLTTEQLQTAQTMYAYGIPAPEIAGVLKISEDTLKNKYGHKMEEFRSRAKAKVAQTLYQMAISGLQPAATFFWLKTQGGWRETDRLEIESRNVNVNINMDAQAYDAVLSRIDEMSTRVLPPENTASA